MKYYNCAANYLHLRKLDNNAVGIQYVPSILYRCFSQRFSEVYFLIFLNAKLTQGISNLSPNMQVAAALTSLAHNLLMPCLH